MDGEGHCVSNLHDGLIVEQYKAIHRAKLLVYNGSSSAADAHLQPGPAWHASSAMPRLPIWHIVIKSLPLGSRTCTATCVVQVCASLERLEVVAGHTRSLAGLTSSPLVPLSTTLKAEPPTWRRFTRWWDICTSHKLVCCLSTNRGITQGAHTPNNNFHKRTVTNLADSPSSVQPLGSTGATLV